ncbi:Nif3-like dinuclear metal center hexameric protein [Streptococcus didelphis]|uniref:GTP cyclohydrolase 1 type 2 homolog n=1 Tax=Streptococcus didelphis TaxID=102886 RepID=A0ABY9LH04_9STRE|nr:Nif3-like dinuclear metal center hexameric protein [Streptococcus didelphis]WMB28146.1 Nif3-like dinuclear metal center hexameric protein [Streptococcus didelphis]
MKASQVIQAYENYCPPELSMKGDVVGLQVGTLDKDIKRVMVTLDVREQTVQEAIAKKVDLIITKHAPIFKGIKDLVSSPQRDILLELVKHDIAVYVSHTNIDVLPNGLNDWFCQELGITDTSYLSETQEGFGIGRIGTIPKQSLESFALKIKESFKLDAIRLVRYQSDNPEISQVAICGGSGGEFYKDALAKGAQLYITGDIYYHTAQEMLTEGLLAIDPGHHIEALFIEKLSQKLHDWKLANHWEIDIIASQASTNPFSHL